MSTALIRSNLLTELANRSEIGSDALQQMVDGFLADAPGPWLPEEYTGSHALVARSRNQANSSGRAAIDAALVILLQKLFEEIKIEKLSVEKSRQLLGILALKHHHPSVITDVLARIVEFASFKPDLFWERITCPFDQILGDSEDEKRKFIRSIQQSIVTPAAVSTKKPARSLFSKYFRKRSPAETVPTPVAEAIRNSEPFGVQIVVNGRARRFSVVRLPRDHRDYVFWRSKTEEDTSHTIKLPDVTVDDESPVVLMNAATTRIGAAISADTRDSADWWKTER